MRGKLYSTAVLTVLTVSGMLTVNGDYGPYTCATIAKQLRSSDKVADAFCVAWVDDKGSPDLNDPADGNPVIWTKTTPPVEDNSPDGQDTH